MIGVVVLAALALPGVARAHGGGSYAPTLTATAPALDGTVGSDWAAATPYSVTLRNPFDNSTIPATVRFLQTSTTLYVGVVVQDASYAPGNVPSISVLFDNTHDGIENAGDDAWLEAVGDHGQDFFFSSTGLGGGSPSRYNDTADTGGVNDTIAASSAGVGNVMFEVSHPLCSADQIHDICLQPGITAGIDFQYEPGSLAGGFFTGPGPSFADPSLNWADLTPATSAPPASGSLTGSLNTFTSFPVGVDLTATGTEDWAIWGTGSSTSLVPDDRKANGGNEISALTYTSSPGNGVRNFGSLGTPFGFTWTDGAPTASGSGVQAGLTDPSLGLGVSFTVPADTTDRTLTVFTSTHYANGTLTAHLSDGSAADYTNTLSSFAGSPGPSNNYPGVFTLHYHAASAGQTLTVSWVQTANNNCGGCEDAVLYAVALSQSPVSVTGATASVSTTTNTIGMSGSNDSIAALPLAAFNAPATGTSAAPINGLPINGLPINGLPINGLPINGLPINGLPINGLPINGLPINGLPINGLPINGLPINGLSINGLPINGLPLNTPGGWEAALAGTALAGLPLQTITLQQVFALPNPPHIQLGDLDLSASALGNVTIGALVLGSTPINGLGLPADALSALVDWCRQTSTDPSACNATAIGGYSLFSLALEGAPINGLPINGLPINGLPINGLPINGLPINGLALSASPIADIPINGLPINGLPSGLPANATLGDLPNGFFTVGQLLQILVTAGKPVTLGDVIAMMIRRTDVPWEDLSPRLLSVFDSSRPQLPVTITATIAGTGSGSAKVVATLPAGFDAKLGTSALAIGPAFAAIADPVVSGQTLTWSLASVPYGSSFRVAFTALPGTDVGPAQISAVASAGTTASAPGVAALTVGDSFEPNDAVNEFTPVISPNTNVEQSAISSPGDVDYYKIPLPPAGTRLSVHLTNLPADYDLALYANTTTSIRTSSTPGTTLQDGTVADEAINTQGGVNSQLTPSALQDVPNPGIPIVQVSPNRGKDDEDVGMVSPGGTGYAVIAVFGYAGASSPSPYSLRVTTSTPAAQQCTARSFDHAGEGTAGTAPAIASMPSDLNTLVLVNEKRIGDTYGAAGESAVVSALTRLAGDSALGVSGAVVPVESLAQSAYDAWDTNPCDNAAANTVANAIADEVAAVKIAHPTLKYVVFAGGDDQIPYFRMPDLSRIANETGFAGNFGRNEYYGALAGGNLLTDDPYLDTRPIPAGGRQIFVPDLVGGRLVEKPDQIAGAVGAFESAHGTLARSTGFVSGYDFVTDGSQLVASRLNPFLRAPATTLFSNTWSKTDLLNAAFPSGVAADVNAWNGHYDNHQALAANGNQTDLITTADLTGPHALSGGIFFTMGCHAGFQTSDAIVGSTAPDHLDWAEYMAGTHTAFVGNTGFGLGNTDSVAFSEELMSDFAGNLDGSLSIGEALARAKQDYYLGRTAYSSYDAKTLSEAELYGLPMYGVGVAPRPVGSPTPPPAASPDPVRGTSASSSPDHGTLAPLAGTSAQVAQFSATPSFTQTSGPHGDFLTNAGQVQAPNYRPLQPYVTLPATRTGMKAHGVIVDALTSHDISPFNPANVRPTLDLSANEPEPQFADEAWPEKIPTLVTLDDTTGTRQSLGLMTGQFFVDPSTHAGVEREWTGISGRVAYSTSTDFVPPTIDSINAFVSSGAVTFTGQFSDRTETGAAGTVAFAQVVYDADNGSSWIALPLQHDTSTGTWSAGAAFNGTAVQFFVEVCDVAGNCGYSSNKGRYFNAAPVPPTTGGGLVITAPDPNTTTGFYTQDIPVTASASNGASVSVSVDGGPFTPTTGPTTLTGEGAHVVRARSSDGSAATRVFLIDHVAPTITHTVAPASPTGTNGWYKTAPTVTFTCTDDVSGIAPGSCVVSPTNSNQSTLGESASPQSVTVTATDNAGNGPTTDSVTGLKVDLSPPATPTFTGIQSGVIFPVNSIPAASTFVCSSSDSISGLAGCTVSGYGTAIGKHTLTATATDNAGNTSTSTLTYVVGFQSGNVLPPVTAPSGDQGDPSATDLQAFKIKSTIPVKFRMWLDAAKTTMMTTPPAGSTAKLTFAKYSGNTSTTDSPDLISATADSGNVYRWTGSPDYQYIYNLQTTTSQTAGEYYVRITLYAADGTTILAQSDKQYFILR